MFRALTAAPRLATQVSAASRRQISSSLVRTAEQGERVDISHIKAAQKHFQIDDGTPVYLKGGFKDQVLVAITGVVCVVGLAYSGKVIYSLAIPPQN